MMDETPIIFDATFSFSEMNRSLDEFPRFAPGHLILKNLDGSDIIHEGGHADHLGFTMYLVKDFDVALRKYDHETKKEKIQGMIDHAEKCLYDWCYKRLIDLFEEMKTTDILCLCRNFRVFHNWGLKHLYNSVDWVPAEVLCSQREFPTLKRNVYGKSDDPVLKNSFIRKDEIVSGNTTVYNIDSTKQKEVYASCDFSIPLYLYYGYVKGIMEYVYLNRSELLDEDHWIHDFLIELNPSTVTVNLRNPRRSEVQLDDFKIPMTCSGYDINGPMGTRLGNCSAVLLIRDMPTVVHVIGSPHVLVIDQIINPKHYKCCQRIARGYYHDFFYDKWLSRTSMVHSPQAYLRHLLGRQLPVSWAGNEFTITVSNNGDYQISTRKDS